MRKLINSATRAALLLSLALLYTTFITAQGTVPATDDQIKTKVDDYMKAVLKVEGFSGTILVARDGKPLVNKGYGMANVELKVANTPDKIFRLGSITKQFTGMAIAMLQERGKVSVNDPMCKYLTDCPDAWKPITIKHLLTHTSGITNYTAFSDFAKTTVMPVTTAAMVDRLRPEKLEFTPGERMAYSNSGYFLLGVIIEKVSGKTYEDFLQENIFTPLEMKQSGYDDPLRIIANRAAGYQKREGKFLNASYTDMSVPYAAGSLYSTTGDLLIWDQALYTEKLVTKKTLDEIFTPWQGEAGYGYGWGIRKQFDRRQISHGGGIYGFSTQIARYPDDRVTVIVLSNIQSTPAGQIANNLAAIVFGAPYETPKERKAISLDPKILQKYVGEYQIGTNIIIAITLEDGNLKGQLGGQGKFAIFPESETEFFSKDVNAQFSFNMDADGVVTGFILRQGGGNNPAKKIK